MSIREFRVKKYGEIMGQVGFYGESTIRWTRTFIDRLGELNGI